MSKSENFHGPLKPFSQWSQQVLKMNICQKTGIDSSYKTFDNSTENLSKDFMEYKNLQQESRMEFKKY